MHVTLEQLQYRCLAYIRDVAENAMHDTDNYSRNYTQISMIHLVTNKMRKIDNDVSNLIDIVSIKDSLDA